MKRMSRQIAAYYGLVVLYSCFFATGNWYFLWKLYLTNHGIGMVDALCFAAGLLFEIPSGAMADIFGRKRTIAIAIILMGVGYLTTGVASSGTTILVGYLIYSIGMSFYSGADDALMYDHLKQNGQEKHWKHIVATKHIYMRVAALSSTLIGGWLFMLNVRLPSVIRGIFFLLMLIPLTYLPENYGSQGIVTTFRSYLKHIVDGSKQLLLPTIVPLLPILMVVGGILSTIYVGGLLRPLLLAQAGYDGVGQAYIITVAGVITTLILLFYKKFLHLISDTPALWLMSVGVLIASILMIFLPASSWLPMLFFMQMVQGLFVPTTSDFLNRHIASSHRATTLSSLSLLQSIPYVIAAPLIGVLADRGGYSTILWSITAVLVLTFLSSWLLSLKNTIVKIPSH